MIIDKIETKRNLSTVFCGEKTYVLDSEIVRKYAIKEGQTDGKEFFSAKEESDVFLCKKHLNRLLDHYEKTKQGYLNKLLEKGYPYAVCLEQVEKAERLGLIDDRRFAECYLHIHSNKKGWIRLKQELKQKGVEEDIINSFYDDYADRYEECLLLTKTLMKKVENTFENRQKVFAKLAGKGYSFSEIKKSLCSFGEVDNEEGC